MITIGLHLDKTQKAKNLSKNFYRSLKDMDMPGTGCCSEEGKARGGSGVPKTASLKF